MSKKLVCVAKQSKRKFLTKEAEKVLAPQNEASESSVLTKTVAAVGALGAFASVSSAADIAPSEGDKVGSTAGMFASVSVNQDANGSVFGSYAQNSSAIFNSLTIKDNVKVGGSVYGGVGSNVSAQNNVTLNSGVVVEGSVVAGNGAGIVKDNIAKLNSASVKGNVTGAVSQNGEALSNTVEVNGGKVGGNLLGAITGLNTTFNQVVVNNAVVTGETTGAFGNEVSKGNLVKINNSSVQDAIGGVSVNSNATENYVRLDGGSATNLIGAKSGSTGIYNAVLVTSGVVSGNVTANIANASAYNNFVTLAGGEVKGAVTAAVAKDLAKENRVTLLNSSSAGSILGVAASTAEKTEVIISEQASLNGDVVGALTSNQATSTNVTVKGSVKGSVIGANSSVGALASKVDVLGTSVGGDIYGQIANTTAMFGFVNVANAQVGGDVYGIKGGNIVTAGVVTVSNSNLNKSVYGGYSTGGVSTSSNVTVSNSNIKGDIYGGFSANGNASFNTVQVFGSNVSGKVFGGFSNGSGSANLNIVHIQNSVINAANKANVSDSKHIYSSEESSFDKIAVIGGYSKGGKTQNNIISIVNSTIYGDICGGANSQGKSESYNQISMTNSFIAGKYIQNCFVNLSTNNSSAPVVPPVANGTTNSTSNSTAPDAPVVPPANNSTGNTTTPDPKPETNGTINGTTNTTNPINPPIANNTTPIVPSAPSDNSTHSFSNVTINTSAGLQSMINGASRINFDLGSNVDPQKGALIASDGGALDFTGRKISLSFNSELEGTRVGNTQQVVLVNNARGIDTSSITLANSAISFDKKYTLSHIEAVEVSPSQTPALASTLNLAAELPNGTINASNSTATGLYKYIAHINAQAREEQKVLLEASIAGAIAAIGSGKVAQDMLINAQGEGDIVVGSFDAGSFKQETGSSVKSNNFAFGAGFGRKSENNFYGAFLSGGGGSFETENDFTSGKTIGEGSTSHFAIGLFNKFEVGATSISVLAKFGLVRTSFDAKDFGEGYDVESFKLNRKFYSLGAQVAHSFGVNEKLSLLPFAALTLTTIYGDEASVGTIKYDFADISSTALSLGVRAEAKIGEFDSYASLAYEREFSAEADAINANNGQPYSLKANFGAPGLKGNSGVVEVGADYKLKGAEGFVVGVKLKGSVGKNKGVGGSLNLDYKF